VPQGFMPRTDTETREIYVLNPPIRPRSNAQILAFALFSIYATCAKVK